MTFSGSRFACIALGLLTCVSCAKPGATPGSLADIAPGERPAIETDEAGLWMRMDEAETALKRSGHLLTEGSLPIYIRDLVCRLAGPHCSDIRVYVVRTPHFNASMAPNGAMQVWTGLILRTQNEAQLAYVLGHEMGHYFRRHSIQLWRDARSKTNLLVFFQLMTAAAGYGYVGDLASLVTAGSLFAFSRDNEREADEIGFELMVKARLDPLEAPKIWEAFLKEQKAARESTPVIFFSSHPSPEERIETLKARARQAKIESPQGDGGKAHFLAATLPMRSMFLRDELRQREFARSQVVLDQLLESGIGLGELHFFQGELLRMRNEKGDSEKALEAYQRAIAIGDAPAEADRALGLLYFKTGQKEKARSAFERYLRSRPQAEDREMIRSYLQ